jgi:hypothetical protein
MEHVEFTQQKPTNGNYVEILDQYQTYYAAVASEDQVEATLDYFRATYDWNCDSDMSAEELVAFIENAPDPVSRYEFHEVTR